MNGPGHPAVRIDGLSVRYYLRYEKGPAGGGVAPRLGLAKRRGLRELWALRGIDLSVGKGEIFGVIGANGAGKSTLLKVLAGIIPPTKGSIAVDGTLAPFIELGAAFNPELTGAENIFLTGSIYRVPRRQIKADFNRIVEFAELRNFIDTPVKNYSSGMFVRLAFSSILFFRPDVLLVDEVFAVGDEAFQQKSFEKVVSFKNDGATVIIVSHEAGLVARMCDRVLVLEQGKMSFLGPAQEAVDHYHGLLMQGRGLATQPAPAVQITVDKAVPPSSPLSQSPNTDRVESRSGDVGASSGLTGSAAEESAADNAGDPRRWGNGLVRITSVRFFDSDGMVRTEFRPGDYFEARIAYESRLAGEPPVFGIAFATIYRLLIHGPNTLVGPVAGDFRPSGTVRFIVPELPLLAGDYLFSASCYDRSLQTPYDHHELMYHFRVAGSGAKEFGCVRIDSRWEFGAS